MHRPHKINHPVASLIRRVPSAPTPPSPVRALGPVSGNCPASYSPHGPQSNWWEDLDS